MNRASQEAKKAKRLEIELDKSKQYASIKRVEKMLKRSFGWHKIKKVSLELGFEPIKAYDPNFGSINTYHEDAWRKAYSVEISDLLDAEGVVH